MLFGLVALLAVVAVVAVGALDSGATLTADPSALARVKLDVFAGSLVSAQARDGAGKAVPLDDPRRPADAARTGRAGERLLRDASSSGGPAGWAGRSAPDAPST